MRRTTYRVSSPLFSVEEPTRIFFAQTNRDSDGYRGSVTCVHVDRWGRPVRSVTAAKAGKHSSRKVALRRAQEALSRILVDYSSENITQSIQNV